ncbi:unnamed protein product [Ilex paraguariensis]|uniref:Uncharacterized protein n=1 Tax=Ilex paraguariensis TaxID=185542 RepID=A0ABC8SYN2_9AQUA
MLLSCLAKHCFKLAPSKELSVTSFSKSDARNLKELISLGRLVEHELRPTDFKSSFVPSEGENIAPNFQDDPIDSKSIFPKLQEVMEARET